MINDPTIGELTSVIVGLGGLFFTLWALVDDWVDRRNISTFGTINGPRWIQATGHFYTNGTLTFAWLFYLYLGLLAVYLPPRLDVEFTLLERGAWARTGLGLLFLLAQMHGRVAKYKLRRLPRSAWVTMFREILKNMPKDDTK